MLLAASRVGYESLRRDACSVAKNASRVFEIVIIALMAVFDKVTDATRRKVTIIGIELLFVPKQGSTQIKMKSQAAVLCIRVEL